MTCLRLPELEIEKETPMLYFIYFVLTERYKLLSCEPPSPPVSILIKSPLRLAGWLADVDLSFILPPNNPITGWIEWSHFIWGWLNLLDSPFYIFAPKQFLLEEEEEEGPFEIISNYTKNYKYILLFKRNRGSIFFSTTTIDVVIVV